MPLKVWLNETKIITCYQVIRNLVFADLHKLSCLLHELLLKVGLAPTRACLSIEDSLFVLVTVVTYIQFRQRTTAKFLSKRTKTRKFIEIYNVFLFNVAFIRFLTILTQAFSYRSFSVAACIYTIINTKKQETFRLVIVFLQWKS